FDPFVGIPGTSSTNPGGGAGPGTCYYVLLNPCGGNPAMPTAATTKSPARQQCEQQAQQKNSYAQQAIPKSVVIAANIALDVGMGVAAIGGCVAGGTAGFAVGGPGGAAGGCAGGALISVPAAFLEVVGTTALVAGATYLWESYSAKQDLN